MFRMYQRMHKERGTLGVPDNAFIALFYVLTVQRFSLESANELVRLRGSGSSGLKQGAGYGYF